MNVNILVNCPKYTLIHVVTVPYALYHYFDGQVRYMMRKGFEVHGISSPGELLERFADREGAITHAIGMPRAISPLRDLISVWRLYCLFRRLRPDIVHSHTPKGGLLGMIAAFFARVPIRIYHLHGLRYVTATGLKRTILRLTDKISCYLSHQVFCVSKSLANQVYDEKYCERGKVRVILNGSINGVDTSNHFNPGRYDAGKVRDSLGIPCDAMVLGFVGRLVMDKGITDLVDSWLILKKMYGNLHLLLIGPFEEQDPIPITARNLLMSDERVYLTGYVDDSAPFYAAMDIFAFPTHREGFGLVAIEASAMRKPVVTTRILGCVDAVEDRETGILVPPNDPKALAEAIKKLINNPLLRERMGKAGRKKVVRDFQPEMIWQALYDEYARLLKEKKPPIPSQH